MVYRDINAIINNQGKFQVYTVIYFIVTLKIKIFFVDFVENLLLVKTFLVFLNFISVLSVLLDTNRKMGF